MPTPRDPRKHVGAEFVTANGLCTIVELREGKRVVVRFHATGTLKEAQFGNLKQGKVKDPYFLSVCGVGCIGEGPYGLSAHRSLYQLWSNMLLRCYTKGLKYHNYEGCRVVKRWRNFQTFCSDIVQMPNYNMPGFDLDKDLRVLGNRTYGPKFCSFVPSQVNTLIIYPLDNDKALPLGVHRVGKKFRAQLKTGKKQTLIAGYFDTIGEAQQAYDRERTKRVRRVAKQHRDQLHPEVYKTLRNLPENFFIYG